MFSRVTVIFAGVENFQRNEQGSFAEGMQFIVPTYWVFFVWQPQLDGTKTFSHGNDSGMIRLEIFMIGQHRNFEIPVVFSIIRCFFNSMGMS